MSTAAIDTVEQQPIYWFALLERAVDRGDHEAAARAQRELRRLGVEVRYALRQGVAPKKEVSRG